MTAIMVEDTRSVPDISWFLNAISDGAILMSDQGSIRHANRPCCWILGQKAGDLIGRNMVDFTATPEELQKVISALAHDEIVVTDEVQLKGERASIPVMLTAMKAPIYSTEQRYLLLFYDITPPLVDFSERSRNELLDGIFHEMGSGILLHYANGKLARMNAMAVRLMDGDDRLDAVSWNVRDENGRRIPYEDAPFQQVLRNGRPGESQILLVGQKKESFVLMHSSPFYIRPGMRPMVITTITDLDLTYRDHMRRESSIKLSQEINVLLRELLTERGPEETIEAALRGAIRITGGEAGCAGLYRSESNLIEYNVFWNFPVQISHLEIPFRKSIFYEMAKAGREGTLSIDHYPEHPAAIPEIKAAGYTHMLGALIHGEGKIAGMVQIFNKARSFTPGDEDNLRALLPGLSAALLKVNYEVRLNNLANRDGLTDLANRRHSTETLQREIDRCNRYQSALSAIMLDIDFFKKINDEHGHLAGDMILVELARVMVAHTRKSDLVARTGGEEFMILLPETQLDGCLLKAQILQEAINAAEISFEEKKLKITVSMGCAQYRPGESLDSFYSRLDELLYSSKGEGRNRITAADA